MVRRIVTDRVKFLMPKDRELLFPAMAVLQAYVNAYETKAHFTGMKQVGCDIHFSYCTDLSPADWQLFQDIGLNLDKPCSDVFADPDSVVDLTEQRLGFSWRLDQHVAQIYGAMIG